MNDKMNIVKTVSIIGTLLGVAGTLVSNWASKQTMNETIQKEVAKALAKQIKE